MNWRVGELISSWHLLPTDIPDAVWPYGSSLLTGDGYLPVYIGGLWNLALLPVLAFNFATLTAIGLNFWGGRTLATRLSDRRAVWIITAIAFATAPSIGLRFFGHYTFEWAFAAPLIIAAGIDVARGGCLRPVLLGLLFFVAYLCSVFYLVFGAICFVIIVAFARPRGPRPAPPLHQRVRDRQSY